MNRVSARYKNKFGEGNRRKGRKKKSLFKSIFGKSLFGRRRKFLGLF